MKQRNADVFAEGYSYGVGWAEHDLRNHQAITDELERLREETRSESQWLRAFYLGALRGYRSVVRTYRWGRWSA